MVKLLDFFPQATSIDLSYTEISWTAEKLFMILFKLEVPIPRPLFGENEPLGSFWQRCDPQKAPPCARPRRLTYRSSKLAQPFLQGAEPRNEQNKKIKTSRNLKWWPFLGRIQLIGWWWVLDLEEFARTLWIVQSLVKGFRICWGPSLAFCHSLTDPSLQLCYHYRAASDWGTIPSIRNGWRTFAFTRIN